MSGLCIHLLPALLAELAHDFTFTAATGTPRILSPAETQALAEALRDCAATARAQQEAFDRIVDERNRLLQAASERDLIAFAKAGAPRPVADPITTEPMLRLAVRNERPNVVDLTRHGRKARLEVMS